MSDTIAIGSQLGGVASSSRDQLNLLADMVQELFQRHGSERPILLRNSRNALVGVLLSPTASKASPINFGDEDDDLSSEINELMIRQGPPIRPER